MILNSKIIYDYIIYFNYKSERYNQQEHNIFSIDETNVS